MIDRPTPETNASIIERHHIHKSDGSVQLVELIDAEFARRLERERDDYKWQLHIAKGEIAEARKMERAWKKEETK